MIRQTGPSARKGVDMPSFTDSLRGYSFKIHQRDNFICVYCGLNGGQWPNWLYLSWDHLLPKGHPLRDDPTYITTACTFCNTLHNKTVFEVEGKTPADLIGHKKVLFLQRRQEYHDFWTNNVRSKS